VHADTLIAGGGLAGTLLAMALAERGQRVVLADPGAPGSASRAAAGLITPLTGQRLARAGDLETLLPAARGRLNAMARRLGRPVHRDTPILRHLLGDRPRAAWPKRATDPAYAEYLSAGPEPHTVWIHGGAVVDVPALLDGAARWLAEEGAVVRAAVTPAAVTEAAGAVRWEGGTFDRVVFCQGAGGANPWFAAAPLRLVKGQVLEGRAPGLPPHPVNRGRTLVPLGGDRFRLGATYDREAADGAPDPEGRRTLEGALAGLLPSPEEAVVTAHLAGFRPATPDGLPLLGPHPEHPRLWLFNGLGSKGLLLGPYYAEHLADALVGAGEVPPEAHWQRFEGWG